MWLFHKFLEAIGGASKLIITDEAASMKAAMEDVLTVSQVMHVPHFDEDS